MNSWFSAYIGMLLFASSGFSVFGATITWQAPVRIGMNGDGDVVALGGKVYAYTAGAAATVNSQAFTAGLAYSINNADLQMSLSSGTGGTSTTVFGVAGAQYDALSASYQAIVKGATYGSSTPPIPVFTVTLKRLTTNRRYLVQLWINDSRAATGVRTAAVTGGGGNTVTLHYNDTHANGGVGYYATGAFTADASTQTFTITGDASSQLNAIQVRDLSTVVSWKGGSGDWDTTSLNWQRSILSAWTNTNNDTAYFWDNPGAVSLTEPITIGGLSFNIPGYLIANNTLALGKDAVLDMPVAGSVTNTSPIAGSFGLEKTGQGRVVLGGADSYTGRTLVAGGTLALHGDGTSRSGAITNNATLELGHGDAIKSSALALGNGSTLSLVSEANTTFAPASINEVSGTITIKSGTISSPAILLTNTLNTTVNGTGSYTVNLSSSNGTVLKVPKIQQDDFPSSQVVTINADGEAFVENIYATTSGGSSAKYVRFTGAGTLTVGATGITGSRSFLPRFDHSGIIILTGPVERNSNSWQKYGYVARGTLVFKNTGVAGCIFESIGTSSYAPHFDVLVNSAITLPNSYNNLDVVALNGNFSFGSANTLNSLNLGNTTLGYTLGTSAHAERVISVLGKTSNLLIAGGPITNGTTTANLTKDGIGILRLDKANTYTGLTTVKAGILRLNTANAVNPDSTGVQVDEGATVEIQNSNQTFKMLSGEGTITRGSGVLTITQSVYPGGTNHIGALTLPANTVLSDNATIYIDAASASGSDTLVFAGTPPDLSKVTLAFTGSPATVFANKDISYLVIRSALGAFVPSQLPNALVPAGWRLKIINGTNVYVEYPQGTVIVFH